MYIYSCSTFMCSHKDMNAIDISLHLYKYTFKEYSRKVVHL